MPMKIEAAIVTQKRPEASFNTDSVNVNGKVFPREVIKNGYKGSGVISGSVYFALTSSEVDGFADAAVAAFNERAEVFPVVRDVRSAFSGFYEDCRSALLNMNKSEYDLRCACFYASGRKAVLASNGDVKIYLNRMNTCTPVTPEKVIDTVADYGSSIFPDVNIGDVFILMSPGAAEVLTEKDIEDICRISDGSVKRIVNYITKVGLSKEGKKAVSAIVVKILDTAPEDELPAAGFVPDFSGIEQKEDAEAEAAAENAEVTENVEAAEPENTKAEEAENVCDESVAASESDEINSSVAVEEGNASENESVDFDAVAQTIAQEAVLGDTEAADIVEEDAIGNVAEENASEEALTETEASDAVSSELSEEEKAAKAYKRTRIMLFSILGVLVVISLVLIGILIAGSGSHSSEENLTEETSVEETTVEETTEEETTEEETTEEESTEEETVTSEETTTRRTQSAVTPVTPSVPTTAAPRPSETTTKKPAETTTASEETTVASEETTVASEETEATTEEEKTTQAASEEVTEENGNAEEQPNQTQEAADEAENAPAGTTEEQNEENPAAAEE